MHIIVKKGAMEVPASAGGAGTAVDFSEAGPGSTLLQIGGSFVASYQIEGSIDEGSSWTDLGGLFFDVTTGSPAGSAIAAPALFAYGGNTRPPPKIRWKNVAYTSGTPTGLYSYRSPL